MSNEAQSFKATKARWTLRSPGGVRGYWEWRQVIWAFQDEASDVTLSQHEQARIRLNDTIRAAFVPVRLVLFHLEVGPGGHDPIIPDGGSFAILGKFQRRLVSRPPSLSIMQSALRGNLRGATIGPLRFRLLIDISGSMDESTIQPVLDELIAWASATYDSLHPPNQETSPVKVTYIGENWADVMETQVSRFLRPP